MRPLKLVAQAFGPFAGRTEIDFRAVESVPLFGIYGPTGSGKTSLLDAICFALFGESSGGERSPEHLRSHHAEATEETFIELIFAIGDRRFLIRRSPTQEVARRRGQGTTTRQHEAYLFEVTLLDIEAVSYPDNPGQVLAERKITEVNARIEALLGYTASQFRQVVVLPQGRFRDLLVAKSGERSQILRQLFDTDLYERITERLKTERSEIKADLDRADEAKKTLLSNVGVATELELLAAIEDKTRACTKAVEEVGICDKAKIEADRALMQGRTTMGKFDELMDAQTAHDALVVQGAAIDAKRRELNLAVAAAKVILVADKSDEARSRLEKAKDDYQKRHSEALEAAAVLTKAQAAYEASREKETERESLRRQRDQLERYKRIWEELANDRKALQETKEKSAKAEEDYHTAEGKLQAAQDAEAQARRESERLSEAKTVQVSLEVQVERLQQVKKALEEVESTKTQIAEKKIAIANAASEVETKRQALEEAKDHCSRVEEGFLGSTASHLAAELKPGEPCPVCGSNEHPAPAEVGAATMVTRKDLESARTAVGKNQDLYSKSVETLNSLGFSLKYLQDRLENLTAKIPLNKTAPEVVAELEPLQADLKAATSLAAKETEIRQSVHDAEFALRNAHEELNKIRGIKHSAAEEVIRLQANLDAALRDIPEPLRNKEKIIAEYERIKNQLQTKVQHHQALEEAYTQASSDSSSKSALTQQAEEGMNEAAQEASQARAAFEDALKRAGFQTEEIFRTAYQTDATITELREEIDAFERNKKSVEDRLLRAITEVEGKSRPDLEELEAAVDKEKTAADQAREMKTSLETVKAGLERTWQGFHDKAAEYDQLDQAYRKIAVLSEVADGRGANVQRIRLVDYVLSAYFDDILRQANIRFCRMSKERYQLRRKQTPTSLRSSAGLEISVYDAYTDQERDAATLSGGESFLAALSLALGLSDVVQAEAGGIRLDAIFIDEGFGHLDEEALDEALDTLVEISGSSRAVGIISHVEEVKRMVPQGFDVVRALKGSNVQVRLTA